MRRCRASSHVYPIHLENHQHRLTYRSLREAVYRVQLHSFVFVKRYDDYVNDVFMYELLHPCARQQSVLSFSCSTRDGKRSTKRLHVFFIWCEKGIKSISCKENNLGTPWEMWEDKKMRTFWIWKEIGMSSVMSSARFPPPLRNQSYLHIIINRHFPWSCKKKVHRQEV